MNPALFIQVTLLTWKLFVNYDTRKKRRSWQLTKKIYENDIKQATSQNYIWHPIAN